MSKLLGWLAIILMAGLAYWWQPELFRNAYNIIEHGDIAALAEYLRSFGAEGILVTIFLFVIMTFTIVFPFMILSGATAIVYGLFWGTIISWMGEFIGAIFMFVFARYFFRGQAEKWIAKSPYLKQVDDYSAAKGFKALLFARLLPLAPSGIITAVAAVSRISWKHFLAATLIGKLPPVIIKVVLGHDLVYASENMGRIFAVVALIAIIYGGLWWRRRRKMEQKEEKLRNQE